MINNKFWRDAASSWSWNASEDVIVKIGDGGQISEELLKMPWEMVDDELIDFDKIDYEATRFSMMQGGDVVLKEQGEDAETSNGILLDMDKFDVFLEMETMSGFTSCFKMLKDCGLQEVMTNTIGEIIDRIDVLEEAGNKFKRVYEADLSMFIENYIPEALNLLVGYIEYINAKVDEKILINVHDEVIAALNILVIGINDKIDEIYKFASIEIKAAAKALNANMNMDGHVDPKFKIN